MVQPDFNPAQADALRRMRWSWAITLVLTVPLPFIVMLLTGSDWLEQKPDAQARQSLGFAVAVGVGALFIGLFARNQAYKAHWRADIVEPAGYVNGNTYFFLAVLIGAVGVFLISVLAGYPAPTFAAAPIFVGLLAMNFPNGKPMLPAPPRIGEDGGLQ